MNLARWSLFGWPNLRNGWGEICRMISSSCDDEEIWKDVIWNYEIALINEVKISKYPYKWIMTLKIIKYPFEVGLGFVIWTVAFNKKI